MDRDAPLKNSHEGFVRQISEKLSIKTPTMASLFNHRQKHRAKQRRIESAEHVKSRKNLTKKSVFDAKRKKSLKFKRVSKNLGEAYEEEISTKYCCRKDLDP